MAEGSKKLYGSLTNLKRSAVDEVESELQSPSKMANTSQEFTFETPNRFAPLNNIMDTIESVEETNSSSIIAVPPIFIQIDNVNYSQISKTISSACSNKSFTTKLIGKQLKVCIEDPHDYRKATKSLQAAEVEFHSFKDPTAKILSVVIKDVPTSLTDSEIFSELTSLSFSVLKVARLFKKDKLPIPVVAVELQDISQSQEIFNLRSLFYSIVKVEPRNKTKQVTQCTRCQRRGHTKNYCHLKPRCVKCTNNPPHHTKDCTKKDTITPAKCVNCDGDHPANYRGCTYLKKSIRKPVNNADQTTPHFNITSSSPPARPTSAKSYAECVASASTQPNEDPINQQSSSDQHSENFQNNADSFTKIILGFIKMFLPQIKSIIKSLINEILSSHLND